MALLLKLDLDMVKMYHSTKMKKMNSLFPITKVKHGHGQYINGNPWKAKYAQNPKQEYQLFHLKNACAQTRDSNGCCKKHDLPAHEEGL